MTPQEGGLTDPLSAVHGYSLLRTQLNNDYFHDIFDVAQKFDVHIESHRACIIEFASHM
jgi:glutamine synthetase